MWHACPHARKSPLPLRPLAQKGHICRTLLLCLLALATKRHPPVVRNPRPLVNEHPPLRRSGHTSAMVPCQCSARLDGPLKFSPTHATLPFPPSRQMRQTSRPIERPSSQRSLPPTAGQILLWPLLSEDLETVSHLAHKIHAPSK